MCQALYRVLHTHISVSSTATPWARTVPTPTSDPSWNHSHKVIQRVSSWVGLSDAKDSAQWWHFLTSHWMPGRGTCQFFSHKQRAGTLWTGGPERKGEVGFQRTAGWEPITLGESLLQAREEKRKHNGEGLSSPHRNHSLPGRTAAQQPGRGSPLWGFLVAGATFLKIQSTLGPAFCSSAKWWENWGIQSVK